MESRSRKHVFMVLLTVVITFLIGSISSAHAAVSGDYTYTVSNGKATITKYTGTAAVISIPSTLGGYPVRVIGDFAFENANLTSVTIPNGVVSIEGGAFTQCIELTSITIPNSVTSIASVAFSCCFKLASITIPDNVTSIGAAAFANCKSLTSVTIPAKVTSIGRRPFGFCDSLTNITVSSGNTAYKSINGILYDKSMKLLLAYPAGKNTSNFSIPSGVTSICDAAFSCGVNLTSIAIPNSVTSIEFEAFWGSDGLSSISIPNSVTSIDDSAFADCNHLASINISSSVTSIGKNVFEWCSNLSSINVDSENAAFASADGVLYNKSMKTLIAYPAGKSSSSFVVPPSVIKIGDSAFVGCSLANITIPSSVTAIGKGTFFLCNNLTSITLPDSVTSIGASAFECCESLTSITIPDSITSIGNYAFYDCDGLTIHGYADSYAQTYAQDNDIPFVAISVDPLSIASVSADKTIANIGTAITWTATATGGSGTKSYRFKLYKDGLVLVGGTYCSANTYKYTPTEAGTYKVRTYVQDSTSTVTKDSANIIVKVPLSITSVKADRTSANVGTAITWSVTATGGSGTKTYRFKLYKDGVESMGGTYGSANTYKYTPTEAGTYKVRAYVTDSTGTVTKDSANVTVIVPLSITSVTADKTSANAGSAITWTAAATGGSGTKSYLFKLYKDGIVIVGGTYSSASTYKYTPTQAGTYKVRAYVKDSTGTVAKTSADVIVKVPLSITSVKADKTSTVIGSAITWTAAATGGSGSKTYRFKLYKNGTEIVGGTYGTASTYKYTPTETGTYKVRTYVKDSTGIVTRDSADVIVKKQLSITSVKADRTSANAGTAITWTAAATGGNGTKTYRFLLYKDGTELASSKYTTSATYKYTPTAAGTYRVRAYVKDSTGEVSLKSAEVTVKAPLSITSVTADKTSADVGSEITWTASATGGSGSKSYRFKLYKDDIVLVGGTYSSDNTYKYTPVDAGIYKVRVYIKDSTVTETKDSIDVTVK